MEGKRYGGWQAFASDDDDDDDHLTAITTDTPASWVRDDMGDDKRGQQGGQ